MKFTLFCGLSVLGILLGWHGYTVYKHTSTVETGIVVALGIILIVLSSLLVPIKRIETMESLSEEPSSPPHSRTGNIFTKISLSIAIITIVLVILLCMVGPYLISFP